MKKLLIIPFVFLASQCFGAFQTDRLTATSTFTVTGGTIAINGTTYYWQAGTGSNGQFLKTDGGARPTLTFGTATGSSSSILAVGTGTASNFTTNITSPTAVISFNGTSFRSVANGTTNFIDINLSTNSPGASGFIFNQDFEQSGSTASLSFLNVYSSGNIYGPLDIGGIGTSFPHYVFDTTSGGNPFLHIKNGAASPGWTLSFETNGGQRSFSNSMGTVGWGISISSTGNTSELTTRMQIGKTDGAVTFSNQVATQIIKFSSAPYDCTGKLNGGALTADANGLVSCTDDDSGGGGSTIYNATSTAGFPFGFSASTGVFTSTVTADAFYAVSRMMIGDTDMTHVVNGSTFTEKLSVHAEGSNDSTEVVIHRHSPTPGFGAFLILAKSSGTEASELPVTSGHNLGRISALGYDGSDYAESSNIRMEVDATPGANDMPGRIVLATSRDGTQSPTDALIVDSSQTVRLAAVGPGVLFSAVTSSGIYAAQVSLSTNVFGTLDISANTNLSVLGPSVLTNDTLSLDTSSFALLRATQTFSGANTFTSSTDVKGPLLANSSVGNIGDTLRSNGPGLAPTWSAGAVSSFTHTFRGESMHVIGSSQPYISFSTGEASGAVYYDETSTQAVTMATVLDHRYNGGTLYADLIFTSTATSGTVNLGVYVECKTPNADAINYDTDNFDVINSTSGTVGSTSGMLLRLTATLTNNDSCSSRDSIRLLVTREAGVSDTAVGFLKLRFVELYEL